MRLQKPLIVFVFSHEGTMSSTKYGGFAKRLINAGGFKDNEVLTVALENLIFIINEDKTADVIDAVSKRSLGDASLVYFKSWSLCLGEACALGHYLRGRGISFMDTRVLGVGDTKISTIMRLWANGVNVPATRYSRNQGTLLEYISSDTLFSKKFVLKDISGTKGNNNYLVDVKQAKKIIKQNPEILFVAQRAVPNNGDWRIGIYANQPAFAIHRKGSGKTHLNNTSAGGIATYYEITKVSKKIIKIAQKAAGAAELQVAGVDVIVDAVTNRAYILEVNQGSQIVTGVFVDENISAFNRAFQNAAFSRYTKTRQQNVAIIGRRTIASLPELKVLKAVAKIDTGAYTSTLHAENIRLEQVNGKETLAFDITKRDGFITEDDDEHTIRTAEYFIQKVRSSNGELQDRYCIHTKLVIGGNVLKATLTLSDRAEMGYPLLIGRKVIRSRFLVNVELNEEMQENWRF